MTEGHGRRDNGIFHPNLLAQRDRAPGRVAALTNGTDEYRLFWVMVTTRVRMNEWYFYDWWFSDAQFLTLPLEFFFAASCSLFCLSTPYSYADYTRIRTTSVRRKVRAEGTGQLSTKRRLRAARQMTAISSQHDMIPPAGGKVVYQLRPLSTSVAVFLDRRPKTHFGTSRHKLFWSEQFPTSAPSRLSPIPPSPSSLSWTQGSLDKRGRDGSIPARRLLIDSNKTWLRWRRSSGAALIIYILPGELVMT